MVSLYAHAHRVLLNYKVMVQPCWAKAWPCPGRAMWLAWPSLEGPVNQAGRQAEHRAASMAADTMVTIRSRANQSYRGILLCRKASDLEAQMGDFRALPLVVPEEEFTGERAHTLHRPRKHALLVTVCEQPALFWSFYGYFCTGVILTQLICAIVYAIFF